MDKISGVDSPSKSADSQASGAGCVGQPFSVDPHSGHGITAPLNCLSCASAAVTGNASLGLVDIL